MVIPSLYQRNVLSFLPFYFLWLFVFTVPSEEVMTIDGVGSITRIVGICALGIGLLAIICSGRIRQIKLSIILYLVFILWSALSCFWTSDPARTDERVLLYVQLFGLLWLVWQYAAESEQRRRLIWAYVLGVYITAACTIWNYTHGKAINFTSDERFAGMGRDPNDLALLLALGIPLAWYVSLLAKSRLQALISRLYIPLALFTIGLTGSRGSTLATLFALMMIPATFQRQSFKRKLIYCLVLVISSYFAWTMLPAASQDRLLTVQEELSGGSFTGRRSIWKAGLVLFYEHPILGIGSGAFPTKVAPLLGGRHIVAHNTFLSVLVELGVIGFTLFYTPIALCVRSARHYPHLERSLYFVLLSTWSVGAFALTWDSAKVTWFLFALFISQTNDETCKEHKSGSHWLYSRSLIDIHCTRPN